MTFARIEKVNTIGRNMVLVEKTHALMTSPRAFDQQGPIDGSTRMFIVSASEKHSTLNTSVKLQGSLSSAAGSNCSPYEKLEASICL